MARAKTETSERTYLGFAQFFYPAAGAPAIRPGDKVSLTDDQYAALTRGGHSFDPPWTADGDVVVAPHEVPDGGGENPPAAPADSPAQTNV